MTIQGHGEIADNLLMAGSRDALRRVVVPTTGLLAAAFFAGSLFRWGSPTAATWVGDIAAPLASGGGAVVAALACRPHHGRRRLAWLAIAAALACWCVGECTYSWYELVAHVDAPFPSLADVGYLAAYPIAAVGVVLLAVDGLRMSWLRTLLDALLLTGAVTLVSAPFVIEPMVSAGGESMGALVISLAYPIADVVLLAVVLLVLTRGLGGGTPVLPLVIVLVSIALQVLSDSLYAGLSLHNAYSSGGPVDAGWLTSYLLLGIAPLFDAGGEPRPRRLPWRWEIVLPYAAVATTVVGTVVHWVASGKVDWLRLAVLAGMVLVLLARQGVVVAQNLQLVRRLEGLAFTDGLTGLANRSLLQDRLAHALARRGDGTTCILLLDLDGFKGVNDSLGHAQGDALLAVAAERLTSLTRAADTVGRLGGDEFAMLLGGDSDLGDGVRLARRLLEVLSVPYRLSGGELSVPASIGIACAAAGSDPGALLQQADLAMYAAKAQGKSQFAVYDPAMQEAVLHRLALERDLRIALDSDELSVAYQPILDLSDGTVQGVEALVRWRSPDRGDVPPAEFIPVAEECGLITAVGELVLMRAATQVAAWRAAGHDLVLSVNVSPRQLASTVFVDTVRTAIAATGLPGDRLVIELTEGVLVDEDAVTAGVLKSLRQLGVRIAIDDFGTGWSSLSYLRRLPVDIVKIDRSFVHDLGRDEGVESLTRAIVALSRDLRLTVVAEGVEEPMQLATLGGMGCQLGQGFLLARPQDAEATRSFLVAAPPLPPMDGDNAPPPVVSDSETPVSLA